MANEYQLLDLFVALQELFDEAQSGQELLDGAGNVLRRRCFHCASLCVESPNETDEAEVRFSLYFGDPSSKSELYDPGKYRSYAVSAWAVNEIRHTEVLPRD